MWKLENCKIIVCLHLNFQIFLKNYKYCDIGNSDGIGFVFVSNWQHCSEAPLERILFLFSIIKGSEATMFVKGLGKIIVLFL